MGDVDALIQTHAADFGRIQIADAPGRGASGSGSQPLLDWIQGTQSNGCNAMLTL
jgi:hydroxypyruvate isomerase